LLAQQLLDSHAEPLVRKALLLALQGDAQMIRVLLAYALVRPKELPVKTGPLRVDTAAELAQTLASLLQKVGSGQLAPSQAQGIADLLEDRRRVLETLELDSRVRALQQLLSQEPGKTNR
jgi:hypothetical protein